MEHHRSPGDPSRRRAEAAETRSSLVAVTGAHRGEAFAACEFIMDYLKTRAPFWKKEDTPTGPRWVDARATDDAAAARWKTDPESH